MSISTHGIISASQDSDAVAFFARAAISDATQRRALNDLVKSLKAANLWGKMTAIYPIIGGTASSHSKNLRADQYNITWVWDVIHSAAGVASDGIAGYGDTNLPASVLDFANIHASVYLTGSVASGKDAFGVWDGGQRILGLEGQFGTNTNYTMDCNHLADGRMVSSSYDGLSLTIITRRSLSDAAGYNRGVSVASDAVAKASVLNPGSFNLHVLGRNSGGSPSWYNEATSKFFSFGAGLTASDAAALYNIVQAFQTTLGRQI